MHIDQLSYFLHVAETGSINSVAHKFFISQQAINAQLTKLEDELEVPLLKRTNQGITLTPQGQLFLPYAQTILHQQEIAKLELQRFTRDEIKLAGKLSIFSASIFSDLFLPRIIGEFMQLHPRTIIKIIDVANSELLSYLFSGYCDLVLFSAEKQYIQNELNKYNDSDIHMLPLLNDDIVLCARPDHPLIRYKTIDLETLEHYARKKTLRYSLYQITPNSLSDLALGDTISTSNNVELHKKLLLEDVAVTYMPRLAYLTNFQQDGLAHVPILTANPIVHCMLYRTNTNNENIMLLDYFLSFAKKRLQNKLGVHWKNN